MVSKRNPKSKQDVSMVKEGAELYTAQRTAPSYKEEIYTSIKTQDVIIIDRFASLEYDYSWSFEGCTTKDTNYITHGYHRYPAKFIPQLANRLIRELTKPGDLVCDPFMGSGTTLVEAKVLGRGSIGVDVNPVALLIAKAKVTAIEPIKLHRFYGDLSAKIESFRGTPSLFPVREKSKPCIPHNERIDYWFKPDIKNALGSILAEINLISDEAVKTFFLCGFSHILKTCSIWLQRSTKPTRDFGKVIPNPYNVFLRHCKLMLTKNNEYYNLLRQSGFLNIESNALYGDVRQVPIGDNSVTLVVTSPPYVTSYEYADLHQLTALWLNYATEVRNFRKGFIGSSHNGRDNIILDSKIAENTVRQLEKNRTGKTSEVSSYFHEMRESFIEMHRYLKKGGKTCIVIGDTAFKKVSVPNAEVFVEQMENIGFKIYRIIKRLIPLKILPQTRNSETGRFASTKEHDIKAYPHEYILIMEKE